MGARLDKAGRRAGAPSAAAFLTCLPGEPFRVGGITVLVSAILAVQAIEAGLLPHGVEDPGPPSADPVLVRVGEAPLRLSDLRAQAGPARRAASADELVREGFLEDAAQQLALAQAAEADGLDQALEVRAALALARRRVLSEAYLDLAISRAVTPSALEAAYEAERAEARTYDRVSVRHILAPTEDEAQALLRRLERGERFARLAGRHSLDERTKDDGGSFGMVAPSELPEALRVPAAEAPIGDAVGPLRSDDGWHVLRVDARRRLAMPSFEARAPAIRQALRAEAMREAAERAEAFARTEREPAPVQPDLATANESRSAAAGGEGGGQTEPAARLP